MYRSYKINEKDIAPFLSTVSLCHQNDFTNIFNKHNDTVHKNLNQLVVEDDILDGEKMQQDWFPSIKAHVFISHSHKDKSLAIKFAVWLYESFKIISFIDSCVWGYADDLLQILDNKYCKTSQYKYSDVKYSTYYDYERRNYSSSHVHMMLSTALNKMIDKAECVFFLNSPNSNIGNDIKAKTLSPWIYGEVETVRLITKKKPRRAKRNHYRLFTKLSEYPDPYLKISYPLHMDVFYKLSIDTLSKWNEQQTMDAEFALDNLYNLTPKRK